MYVIADHYIGKSVTLRRVEFEGTGNIYAASGPDDSNEFKVLSGPPEDIKLIFKAIIAKSKTRVDPDDLVIDLTNGAGKLLAYGKSLRGTASE